jgi:hypothetical protein
LAMVVSLCKIKHNKQNHQEPCFDSIIHFGFLEFHHVFLFILFNTALSAA